MRAVFTINLPMGDKRFPTDDFVKRLEDAWGIMGVKDKEEPTKSQKYRELAQDLFTHAPEATKEEELDHVVFFGLIPSDRTKFVVTRQVERQAKFRLLQENLERLERSSEAVIRELLSHFSGARQPLVEGNEVVIYEKGLEHTMIIGHVTSTPFSDAVRIDKKNVWLTLIFATILVLSLAIERFLLDPSKPTTTLETVQRLIPAILTALVVSAVGFSQTYFELKGKRIIDWTVGTERQESSR